VKFVMVTPASPRKFANVISTIWSGSCMASTLAGAYFAQRTTPVDCAFRTSSTPRWAAIGTAELLSPRSLHG
jgi:hypothetical protein